MANESNFKKGQKSGVKATEQQIKDSAKRQDHNAGAHKAQTTKKGK